MDIKMTLIFLVVLIIKITITLGNPIQPTCVDPNEAVNVNSNTCPDTTNVDDVDRCELPESLDPNHYGGKTTILTDCRDEQLDLLKSPPATVNSLKGAHPMICCPSSRVKPFDNLEPLETCTEEELVILYEFENDIGNWTYDDLPDCEPPKDNSPRDFYVYNDHTNCPCGTTCTNGNKCGIKDFDNEIPPTSCGFDKSGNDKFCCKDLDENSERVKEPQKPLFTEKESGKAYPCMDHTTYCDKWIKADPRSCDSTFNNSRGYNSYGFMREVCQGTCNKTEKDKFRSNKCEKGCVDEYEKCPLWSRLGHCQNNPQFMYFHCRESCGSCGFKSPLNKENQIVDDKQYTDSNLNDFMCGTNKIKEKDEADLIKLIKDNQSKDSTCFGLCTAVMISDRFALTAAHCQEEYEGILSNKKYTRSIVIRDGTKYAEKVGVRRYWDHFLRNSIKKKNSIYYDLTLLELERRVIYNFTEYGDSPVCLPHESLDVTGETALVQGFGVEPKTKKAGKLLELPLKIISNDECYDFYSEKFNVPDTDNNSKSIERQRPLITEETYNGLNEGVMCTLSNCDNFTERKEKCDPCQGDSGAPLLLTDFDPDNQWQTNVTVVGIHHGGKNCAKFGMRILWPKWWVRVQTFLTWIKCAKKHASDGVKTHRNVERECDDIDVKVYPPNCDHTELFSGGYDPNQEWEPEYPKGCKKTST